LAMGVIWWALDRILKMFRAVSISVDSAASHLALPLKSLTFQDYGVHR
jgi:hypothetical protein